ncbi:tRNA (5-methylaminomethyl-2-thiouridylate)-methyltransferase [Panacagrimonas perspica]|uniref:tRNA-specific 2-thiouridylase MnmA n=1 Tax=Panacagrimonas perspica TaxID=381431 RepID=A0A4R7PD83_9GAMM|nr:tRNA 2-thiouridine(34) synthase MnmA [Panacagrimonas perspica]TDU31579.1 tRNA (5-methylaminomethyl-2-thiouridylate)-methyltransferase [Panacagrimonas perspica]THD03191.1 tRNA 2-thiouridine(34) synthase MnmA [Panacagrimonas perspica]
MSTPHVIVGLSGGVDSAVAAWRLKDQGYRVSGLFMQNWTEDESAYCSAAEDFQSARMVADELGIPLHRVDFSAEYRERVFRHFLDDYRAGRTPNPDLLCNREVKFQPFREHALRLGADFVATGHYARLEAASDGPVLARSVTEDKDQTYFLALVARAHFERVLFPIGDLTKPQVRELARTAGLPNHRRKDSTGICFIGERPFREFLQQYLKPDPGPIVDDRGAPIGEHQGLMFYTLGQRRGLNIGGRRGALEAPWYVAAKQTATNTLVVSQDSQHPLLMSGQLETASFSWLGAPSRPDAPLQARVRHRQALQDCRIESLADGRVHVRFTDAQRALSPGQYCVLYEGERCLGGGEIDLSFPAAS